MNPIKSFFIFLSFLLFFSFPLSNSLAISIPEENEVAKKFMTMIQKQQKILNDPIANHMIRQVGNHILSFLPPQPFKYSFYIVNDDVFNAFAGPGAHIFVYRGLITSLDSIDELAGIIGHEIAHAASRHVSESIDRSKFISIGSLAGMLAGAIIGSQSGSDSDAGATLMKGSMAIGQTAMLAFTRENETEADEKGIMFLKRSCFSPEGLQSGLMKIRALDFRGTEGIPDYVKTHPGTASRIAHVETILSDYIPPENKADCDTDFRFDMVKYRLLGLYAEIKPTFNTLTTQLKDNPSGTDAAAIHYGLGLVYARKSMREQAIFHLKKALSINIFDPMVLVELGRIYLMNGEPQKALNTLKGIESEPVMGVMAKFHQAAAHLELRNLSTAKDLFNTVLNQAPETYPKAYYHLANILSLEKKKGLSHYYLGLYYAEINNNKTAIIHLNKALEHLTDKDDIKKAKDRLHQLKKEFSKNREKEQH
ncbi:M48 family metallopeptidase [Desulfobacula phenolica]|uniref:Putative Zn-dependent protease, contains TPR repeats n=1 Tax=Desulfobacula phenolica TaxID=90732 RepID=A0A1H2FE87_9BACT|nr:M48 family metallopeptidase [Desulfobacula phenolica]SDU05605.1 Putative Zn-dependent protease, contains TPR repeats [Desulfobacula phenolica]